MEIEPEMNQNGMDNSLLGLDGGNMMMQPNDNQMMDRSLLGLDGGNMMGGEN